MENIAEIPAQACAMPRFEDGAINLQELIRRLGQVLTFLSDAMAACPLLSPMSDGAVNAKAL